MMKRSVWYVVAALALATLACGLPSINLPNVPRITTGPTETLTISEAVPDVQEANITLQMGAGSLNLTGGADGLITGDIQYNVPDWKPTVTSSNGTVTIAQNGMNKNFGIPDPSSQLVNAWSLKLGSTPINLTVNAGAYEGQLDLGGVPLRNLSISDGASSSTVTFDSLNPETLSTFRYETGASTVTLKGLVNANFTNLVFKGGAGTYTLDFTDGQLQHDATVDVSTGVSSLNLLVPVGMAVKVKVTGAISDVNTQGTWTAVDKTYETSGAGSVLTVYVNMGVGSLTLTSK